MWIFFSWTAAAELRPSTPAARPGAIMNADAVDRFHWWFGASGNRWKPQPLARTASQHRQSFPERRPAGPAGTGRATLHWAHYSSRRPSRDSSAHGSYMYARSGERSIGLGGDCKSRFGIYLLKSDCVDARLDVCVHAEGCPACRRQRHVHSFRRRVIHISSGCVIEVMSITARAPTAIIILDATCCRGDIRPYARVLP